MRRLVLASRSPQRSAILTRLGIRYEVRPADVEELTAGPARVIALENALRKARVARRSSEEDVIAADTVVELEGEVYGKPEDEDQARQTLAALSGRLHVVHSGLAVLPGDGEEITAIASTQVLFRQLHSELIDRYVASGEWRGRAGGYAIQGVGALLVREVRGDYENVVGLPVAALLDLWPQVLDYQAPDRAP